MKIKYLTVSFGCLLLLGCDQANKSNIESALSRYKDNALCFSLGVDSRYTDYPLDIINVPEPNELPYNYVKTHRAVSAFTHLGFLDEEEISINDRIQNKLIKGYRYQLTEEGKKYKIGNGFCFGNIVVHEITNSENIEYLQLGSRVDTGKRFYYTYSIQDVPEWAKAPELAEIYNIKIAFDGRLHNNIAVSSDEHRTYSSSIKSTILIKDE